MRLVGAELADGFDAVQILQAQFHDDEVRRELSGLCECFASAGGLRNNVDAEPLHNGLAQGLSIQPLSDCEQNPCCHFAASPRQRPTGFSDTALALCMEDGIIAKCRIKA